MYVVVCFSHVNNLMEVPCDSGVNICSNAKQLSKKAILIILIMMHFHIVSYLFDA